MDDLLHITNLSDFWGCEKGTWVFHENNLKLNPRKLVIREDTDLLDSNIPAEIFFIEP